MSDHTLSLHFEGAQVLRDGQLLSGPVAVEGGEIASSAERAVNAEGYLILPGIIDLHGDAFERHIAPRPTAPFDLRTGLVGTDRDAAANGVTTAWMAQSWSWEGGHRDPDYAEAFLAAVEAYRSEMHTDLRVQLRVETHTVDTEARLIEVFERFGVDYAIFNNHLPEAFQMAIEAPEQVHYWAQKAGRTKEEHMEIVRSANAREAEVPRYLCNLAAAFDRLGVRYGSHDDPDGATRERFSMIGARICEFPTQLGAAVVARAWDEPILMGAPNVVRGGSQSGNVAATDLIAEGCCDALVSDYYYPALAAAAFRLSDEGYMSLPTAWAMISARPAGIMGLDDRGAIELSKRADLVFVDERTRVIEGTMVAGRWSHLCGRLSNRVSGMRPRISVAAE